MREVYVTIAVGLLLFIAVRLLSAENRKADFAALMRPTLRNYLMYALFVVTATLGVYNRLPALRDGSGASFNTFFLVCQVSIGLSAVILLCMNLAKS